MALSQSPVSAAVLGRREEILQVCRKHGCTSVWVFGSMARGDAEPGSDLDLLVEVTEAPTSFFPGGLVMELEALLGRPVHVVERDGLYHRIRERVLSEAIAL